MDQRGAWEISQGIQDLWRTVDPSLKDCQIEDGDPDSESCTEIEDEKVDKSHSKKSLHKKN